MHSLELAAQTAAAPRVGAYPPAPNMVGSADVRSLACGMRSFGHAPRGRQCASLASSTTKLFTRRLQLVLQFIAVQVRKRDHIHQHIHLEFEQMHLALQSLVLRAQPCRLR